MSNPFTAATLGRSLTHRITLKIDENGSSHLTKEDEQQTGEVL